MKLDLAKQKFVLKYASCIAYLNNADVFFDVEFAFSLERVEIPELCCML